MLRRAAWTVAVAVLALGLATVSAQRVATEADAAAPATRFVPVLPTRVLDSRNGTGAPMHRIAGGETVRLRVAGTSLIPADAVAAALNITITEPVAAGYLTAWPAGSAQPLVSSVNATDADQTVANFAIVPIGLDGQIDLFMQVAGHIVVDVSGYWEPAATSTAGRYVALSPARAVDTRSALGAPLGPVAAGAQIDVAVPGLPAGASAVAVNITAVQASAAGYVTVWPAGVPRPLASNVNLRGGDTVPNLAVVPVSADNRISIFTSSAAHIVVDVQGYFTGVSAASSSDGLFVPVAPVRIADTRAAGPLARFGALFDQELTVGGTGGVPADGVSAIAFNVTVTSPWGPGYLASYPGRSPRPFVSNLNYVADSTVAGFALPSLGDGGTVNLVSSVQADVVVDVSGYFTGSTAPATAPPPVKCSDLMGYLNAPGGFESAGDTVNLKMADLSGHHADWLLDQATTAYKIAPGCQYVLVARPSTRYPGSLAMYRIDGLIERTEPVLVSDAWPWAGAAFTPDARWVYLWAGNEPNSVGGSIVAVNMRTGEERFATEVARLNAVVGVTADNHVVVSVDDDFSAPWKVCEFGVFGYGSSGPGGREPCERAGFFGVAGEYSGIATDNPFHFTTTAVYITSKGAAGWNGAYASPPSTLTSSGAYHARLTWDDRPVVSIIGRGVRSFTDAELDSARYQQDVASGTLLLDGNIDDYPEFSRPLRPSREPPMVVDPCAFSHPGC